MSRPAFPLRPWRSSLCLALLFLAIGFLWWHGGATEGALSGRSRQLHAVAALGAAWGGCQLLLLGLFRTARRLQGCADQATRELRTECDRLVRAEDEIRGWKERLDLALDGADLGVWDWHLPSGKVVFSERWAAMLGYRPDEVGGHIDDWRSLIHPDDLRRVLAISGACLKGKAPLFEVEYRLRGREGRWVWALCRGRVVERTAAGDPVRAAGIHLEITAHRAAEEVLRRKGEDFKTLFRRHGAAMLLIDPETGKILDANAAAEKFYGYPPGVLRTMWIWQINALPEEEIAEERRLAQHQKRDYFVFPHRLASGEIRTVEVHSSPVRQEERTVLFSIVHDITDRQKAERALQTSEAYNKVLFADSQIPLVVLDPETKRFTDCNRAAVRIYRYASRDEVLGRSIDDVSAPFQYDGTPSFEAAQRHIDEGLASGSHVFDWRHRRPDGGIWDARVHLMTFRYEGKELIQFSLQDVTEQRRVERIAQARLHLSEFALEHSLEEFLRETLDEAERMSGSRIGFFHFLEDGKILHLQAWSTNTLRTMCTVEPAERHYDVAEAGVWVDCIRERRTVIHNDYASLPHRQGLPPGHAPVVRELVVPVFRGGRIVAVLGVGNKADDYDAADVESVSLLADMAWDIAARKRVEADLQLANERLSALIEQERSARRENERLLRRNELLLMAAGEGIYGVDREGRLTFINPAALAMLGFTADEIGGKRQHDFFHHQHPDGSDYPEMVCPVFQTMKDGVSRRLEDWFIRKDGTGFPVQLAINAVEEGTERVGAVVVFQDLTERKAQESELRRLATTDPLTGLANRRHFLEVLDYEVARFKRLGNTVALLMLDLDHFKRVNDTLGHDAGDEVLKHFAALCQGMLRRIDLMGRLGGEEFAILLPGTDRDGALNLAERLRRAVAETPIALPSGPLSITVSIGMTLLSSDDEGTEAVARADRALYRAKGTGRNRVESEL